MADNYLEKRMADYRSGKLSTPARKTKVAQDRGSLSFRMPPQTIVVIGTPDEAVTDAVSRLVRSGCNVAMIHSSSTLGNKVAQQTGALYYPVDKICSESLKQAMAFVYRRWVTPKGCVILTDDVLVEPSANLISLIAEEFSRVIVMTEDAARELTPSSITITILYEQSKSVNAAMMCAFLALPENGSMTTALFDLR